ncbi:MAG: sigma-54 interaction domain-containing protein [Deltaproteobacteria bacterium]
MEAIRDISPSTEEYFTFRRAGFSGNHAAGKNGMDHSIITQNPQMLDILSFIAENPEIDSTTLITGETGTGKELIASAIHSASGRNKKPLVVINCAAIPDELFESELFGHKRGAFTGAIGDRKGFFQMADGGTILLDEVAEMPVRLQAKLLRVIEEGEITPLGSDSSVKIDVRILAATNRDLPLEIQKGRFREDLYYRLNVIPIALPPLRNRREDIPLLAGYFLTKYSARFGKAVKIISREAMNTLVNHHWQGNIRELRNVIERAVALERGDVIADFALPPCGDVGENEPEPLAGVFEMPISFREIKNKTIESLEKDYLRSVLREYEGKITEAARHADMNIKNFTDKMKKYGIKKEAFIK